MNKPAPQPASPRRSLHFVPGGNERMLQKSLELAADSLILDLEDSVTPDNKATARAAVADWLRQEEFRRESKSREWLVRINPLASPWGREDLESIMAAKPDGLVVPKVINREDVDAIEQMLIPLEREHKLEIGSTLLILIGTEVPEAVFNVKEMAAHARVAGLTWGAEDLSDALGARATRDANGNYLEVFSFVRNICLLAAAAVGVQPIDTVYVDFKDSEGLKRECEMAADMGFTGKLTIHPAQIDIVNEAFTPGQAAIDEARALIAAFEEHETDGRMAFSFNGQMVDAPHLNRARKLLALAARLDSQSG